MPVGALLMPMNATVTTCHSRTADIPAHLANADIVVAAIGADPNSNHVLVYFSVLILCRFCTEFLVKFGATIGKAEFVKGEWLKPGCVVIDVGINDKEDKTKKRCGFLHHFSGHLQRQFGRFSVPLTCFRCPSEHFSLV